MAKQTNTLRQWTSDDDRKLKALVTEGKTRREIADLLDRPYSSINSRISCLAAQGVAVGQVTAARGRSFAVRFGEGRQKDEAFGVTVGGTAHKTLLAMRACGRIEVNQLTERFGDGARAHLPRLARQGLIVQEENNSGAWLLTEAGRALVAPEGPLSMRRTLQTYCQL